MNRNNTYESPQLTVSSMNLNGFICASIQKATWVVETDEYDNTGVEGLNFDSDY